MSLLNSLLNAVRKKDPFELLIEPYIDHLYRLAFRYTNDQDLSEDLLQDFLVKLYPKYEYIKTIENLRPWLAKSLYNLFIDQIRKNNNDPVNNSEKEDALASFVAESPSIETLINNEQICNKMAEAVSCLSEEHRTLVSLHDIEGYTLVELTEFFNTPIGTLKSRLHRARNKIKESLILMEPFSE
ncbi:MAG: RNA polymerase sigma factor [Gammaproteobacteria bacterium]|nr:MAG: RNA polymerase sigma factor [Gammaproteobacteria bacterium]